MMRFHLTLPVFILMLSLLSVSALSQTKSETYGCDVTLEVADKKYAIMLGQESNDQSDNPDLYLKALPINTDTPHCNIYKEATQYRMNISSAAHPELAVLNEGDIIKGNIAPTIQPPRGKQLSTEYLNNIFITDILDKRRIFPNKHTEYQRSFQHIGVFK